MAGTFSTFIQVITSKKSTCVQELDLVDHQTKDIVVGICEIFLINPTNIIACYTKAPAKAFVH